MAGHDAHSGAARRVLARDLETARGSLPSEVDDDEGCSTGEFQALVELEESTPITQPVVTPRADLRSTPVVKKLVETQRAAQKKANEMLLLLVNPEAIQKAR